MRITSTVTQHLPLCRAFLHWKMHVTLYSAKGNRTKNFLAGRRHSIWFLDLKHSLSRLAHHFSFISHLLQYRARILFVNSPIDLEEYWERMANLYGHDYVSQDDWLHGGINGSFTYGLYAYSLIVLYATEPELRIIQECQKAGIPVMEFTPLSEEREEVDYSLALIFDQKAAAFWYTEAWRQLLYQNFTKNRWKSFLHKELQWKVDKKDFLLYENSNKFRYKNHGKPNKV